MISLEEIFRSIYGAYRLARGDAGGMALFNATPEGFWRSFFAAVLIAPFFAIFLAVAFNPDEITGGPLRYGSIQLISYIIGWTAFPVIMISLCRHLQREQFFVRFIVAYNWASVLQNALFLPVQFLAVGGLFAPPAAAFLALIVLAAILVYVWFIAKTALDINPAAAAGIVFFDLVLSVAINGITDGLLTG